MPYIPSNTTGLVCNAVADANGKLVDSTGNCNWSGFNAPTYNAALMNGHPGFTLNGSNQYFTPDTPAVLDAAINSGNGYEIIFIGRQKSWGTQETPFSKGSGGGKRLWYLCFNGNQTGFYNYAQGQGGYVSGQVGVIGASYAPNLAADSSGNTGRTQLFQGGPWGNLKTLDQTGAVPAIVTADGWAIGCDGNNLTADSSHEDVGQILVYSHSFTDAERAAAYAEINAYYGLQASRPPLNIIFDGNSFFSIVQPYSGYAQEFPTVALRSLETAKGLPIYSISARSFSYGGKTLPQIIADTPAIESWFVEGVPNVFTGFDFQNTGVGTDDASADAICNQYIQFYQTLADAGAWNAAWTPGAYTTTVNYEPQRQRIISTLVSYFLPTDDPRILLPKPGVTWAKCLLNIGDDQYMGDSSLPAAYFQGHPTAAGHAIYAAYLDLALSRFYDAAITPNPYLYLMDPRSDSTVSATGLITRGNTKGTFLITVVKASDPTKTGVVTFTVA